MIVALGAGAAVMPTLAWASAPSSTDSDKAPQPSSDTPPATTGRSGATLVAPLAVGSQVGGCRVESVGDLVHGAVGLVLTDAAGNRFGVEICARDSSSGALRGPAETESFQLYLVNEGDGAIPTFEAHGLAAMAIASHVRDNEAAFGSDGFLTLRDRLQAHGPSLIRPD